MFDNGVILIKILTFLFCNITIEPNGTGCRFIKRGSLWVLPKNKYPDRTLQYPSLCRKAFTDILKEGDMFYVKEKQRCH